MKPIIGDVESFVLIDAQRPRAHLQPQRERGSLQARDRRLRPVRPDRDRQAAADPAPEDPAGRRGPHHRRACPPPSTQRIADGFLFGDFQFSIDEASDDFLRRGVFSCYKPVDPATPMPDAQKELADERLAAAAAGGARQQGGGVPAVLAVLPVDERPAVLVRHPSARRVYRRLPQGARPRGWVRRTPRPR